jgi:hypothetical protein
LTQDFSFILCGAPLIDQLSQRSLVSSEVALISSGDWNVTLQDIQSTFADKFDVNVFIVLQSQFPQMRLATEQQTQVFPLGIHRNPFRIISVFIPLVDRHTVADWEESQSELA